MSRLFIFTLMVMVLIGSFAQKAACAPFLPDAAGRYPSSSPGLAREGGGPPATLPEAVVGLEKSHELSGGLALSAGWLAAVYGLSGQRGKALALFSGPGCAGKYIAPSIAAYAYMGLREWDAAFEWYDRAIEARDPLIVPIKTLPLLDPVRDDPRYLALLRKMKLA